MTALHTAEVVCTSWLTPGMVRLTLGGAGLSEFQSTGIGDEFVRVHFPSSDGELRLPVCDAAGDWQYPDGPAGHVEPYTIRSHDAATGTVVIDVVIHGHGSAGAWAAQAKPGDRIAFGEPRGLAGRLRQTNEQVFVTDATGLPALARLCEQLPPGTRAIAVVEVAEAAHRIPLPDAVAVTWIIGRGNGVAPSALTEALRTLPLSDSCSVWVAGEAGELRAARRFLRHERGLPADQYSVIGYWRAHQESWLEKYAALDQATTAELAALWETHEDEEVCRDHYEDRLTELGL